MLTTGGLCLRKWVRRLAQTQYELNVDSAQILLTTSFAGTIKTWHASTSEIIEIGRKAIMTDGDSGALKMAEIRIVKRDGKSTGLMLGHPLDEIDWALPKLQARLNLVELRKILPP